jgi:uncharacterized protein YggU (UPF0235/DUF167 family)
LLNLKLKKNMNYSIIVIKAVPDSRHKGYKIMPGGTFKIYLNLVCNKGKANLELLEYLANLNVKLQYILIISGLTNKIKRLKILNKNLDYIQQKFSIMGAQQKIF